MPKRTDIKSILILGAGGIGGYYGARMQAAGGDVTFLVRPGRAAQLKKDGLHVDSPFGNLVLPAQVLTQAEISSPYDVVFVSCKAYDLESAIEAIAPAVGPETAIIPLLNGIRHIDVLVDRFGPERVLGGTPETKVFHPDHIFQQAKGPVVETEEFLFAGIHDHTGGVAITARDF